MRSESLEIRERNTASRKAARPLRRRVQPIFVMVSISSDRQSSCHLLIPIRTILSYPLTPFFVIFCNVVGTSNVQDFELLQNVADSVSSLVVGNKSVEKLHRLCSTLLAVCRPMVYGVNAPQALSTSTPEVPTANGATFEFPLAQAELDASDTLSSMARSVDGVAMVPWDDEMMWQLFQCQPSLDWFDSDILDPAAWDLSSGLIPEL
jgi:hypothetical protein